MELNEIMALVNAGYTKADIEALGGSQPQPADQPDQKPAQPEQTPEQPEAKPAETQPAQTQQPESDRYEKLEALLTQLIGTQQQSNLNAEIPGASAQPARTSTDILGSVIAPPRKEKK